MPLKPEINNRENFQGNENANIEIVEFGDYQCGYCGVAYHMIKEIQETFGSQIKFVFRNFPLSEAHPYARIAAIVAEAANLQGKFWEMHDAIYEQQSKLSEDFLIALAEDKGLDIKQLKADMNGNGVLEKIDNDFESGVRSGVNGTPSFFVNGERFDGDASNLYAMLKESTE